MPTISRTNELAETKARELRAFLIVL